ncbi:uncharacterized protein LOC119771504 isoform X2 [Cyprinodon tularosa]|uniref:uncharacterized protein LOC119771504 isoform X2 n=1 Tax=Cyprinodon tularosa TaxID=77115 RepID=UPI0018E1E1BE|nr:uncharacterized protein LOC119771504 isoform X2 [Cyprinodon tularosa]
MATGKAEQQRPHRKTWRNSEHFSCRLFFCSCLCGKKEKQMKINDGRLHSHLDEQGSGEKNVVHITVEDLGIDNSSFSLRDEDPLTLRNSMAHSFSSASACSRALKKKGPTALSTLVLKPQAEPSAAIGYKQGNEAGEQFQPVSKNYPDGTSGSGGLLTTPIINLIPPTPSNIVDNGRFFDSNLDECVSHSSGSDRRSPAGDQDTSCSEETEESEKGFTLAENAESNLNSDELEDRKESVVPRNLDKERSRPGFLSNAFKVPPLPKLSKKWGNRTAISFLSSTEHNVDDLSAKDQISSNMLKTELDQLPATALMDAFTFRKRPLMRSCSLGETTSQTFAFHTSTQTTDQRNGSPQKRRITIASHEPHSLDQNGNFAEKDFSLQDLYKQKAKSLSELSTEEVCQWFTSIGLEKCLPFIREAKLCGSDIASVDVSTLDILHISSLEDKERLLSAIYKELHPPSTITQTIDSLLESLGPSNVETFTAALGSMSRSTSSPHVSCLSMNQRSFKLRNNSQNLTTSRSSQMIEITINASERIVHLRTPKETTVGKIMDSCMKMLGPDGDKTLFTLKEKQDSIDELSLDQQIGVLLKTPLENTQLELHLCKKDKQLISISQPSPEIDSEKGNINKNTQVNQPGKEERIQELNQQVDSLQNVILQVQELHHDLVAFCAEIKNMDPNANLDKLGSAELKQRLEMVNSQLEEKRQRLQILRDNNSAAHKSRQLEVRLLEKMKLNCQVFKEEIIIVHLNRQAANLLNAWQGSCMKEKAQKKTSDFSSLGQLVTPQSPAMLMVVQEKQLPDGHYGFKCCHRDGSGLVVVKADNSHLCVEDRLMEVNGVSVVNATLEELNDLLHVGPCIQIVILRQPPPALVSTCFKNAVVSPDGEFTGTPPQRKVVAI